MGNNYKKFFNNSGYTYAEILRQISAIKSKYAHSNHKYDYKQKKFNVFLKLKPTDDSIEYIVELVCSVGSKKLDVFVRHPNIEEIAEGKSIPHRYPSKALCLFYPYYDEWRKNDLWADTIVPWCSLWLFYFEIWIITGEWLGGGKH